MIVVRVNETGTRGDDRRDDRPALQAAVDRAAAAGGGTVVVPAGMRCRTGTLHLASRVELHLERGSALVASDRPGDYPSVERPVVLAADGAEDVSVAGRGTIEGHARDFIRVLGEINPELAEARANEGAVRFYRRLGFEPRNVTLEWGIK